MVVAAWSLLDKMQMLMDNTLVCIYVFVLLKPLQMHSIIGTKLNVYNLELLSIFSLPGLLSSYNALHWSNSLVPFLPVQSCPPMLDGFLVRSV